MTSDFEKIPIRCPKCGRRATMIDRGLNEVRQCHDCGTDMVYVPTPMRKTSFKDRLLKAIRILGGQ